jgi:hypothetical protein
MFDKLGADILLFDEEETRNWKFRQRQNKFLENFRQVQQLSGTEVFIRRKGTSPKGL